MSDSDNKPQQQLQNSTMRGFVKSLNEKLEKAGQAFHLNRNRRVIQKSFK